MMPNASCGTGVREKGCLSAVRYQRRYDSPVVEHEFLSLQLSGPQPQSDGDHCQGREDPADDE